MPVANFTVKDSREPSNSTLRRLVLAGSLMAEAARQGRHDTASAACWETYLKRWQDENILKKVKP